jgi:hypothetical protein
MRASGAQQTNDSNNDRAGHGASFANAAVADGLISRVSTSAGHYEKK